MKEDKKIVVIGGGTGLSILLKGLKKYTKNISAIVTVADDGGSSGILRRDLGMLPPGDIRACILALSNAEESLEKLFAYRFRSGSLDGQSFGNLLIAAMNDIYKDFGQAIKMASEVLNITGKVLPVTLDEMDLVAVLENGKEHLGESGIPGFSIAEKSPISRIYLKNKDVYLEEESYSAIKEADLIVLGPGSLFTSVIPNLLVKDVIETIGESQAKLAYIPNIMNQAGETDGFNVRDYVSKILKHSREGLIDYILVNTSPIDVKSKYIYKMEDSYPVIYNKEDQAYLEKNKIEIIEGDFIEVVDNYLRHDSDKISQKLMEIAR